MIRTLIEQAQRFTSSVAKVLPVDEDADRLIDELLNRQMKRDYSCSHCGTDARLVIWRKRTGYLCAICSGSRERP